MQSMKVNVIQILIVLVDLSVSVTIASQYRTGESAPSYKSCYQQKPVSRNSKWLCRTGRSFLVDRYSYRVIVSVYL